VTCDDFPFDLYYVKCYDRLRQVRTAVRKCLTDYTQEDGYRQALLEIEAALAEAVKDDGARSIVKGLKEDYRDFLRLRHILESDGSEDEVEAKAKRCLNLFRRRGINDARYLKVVTQIETAWKGLFYHYEDRRIPRTNNGMEDFVKRLRSLWRRITGCSVMDEWILYHAPNAVYLFNFLDGHLKSLGMEVALEEAMAGVERETYHAILAEREVRKDGDRFRRRVNKNPKVALREIVEENKKLCRGSGD
jgi:hypothetical protein